MLFAYKMFLISLDNTTYEIEKSPIKSPLILQELGTY